MINAIIMASGSSRRMGENKLLLDFDGKTLIEIILDKVIECGFNDIVLVARDEGVIEVGRSKGIRVVQNERAELGQSESIKLGIINSKEADGYAFFSGDQPLMNIRTIKYLMKSFDNNADRIVVPTFREKRGTPVIFPGKFKRELLLLTGDIGGRAIISKYKDFVNFIEVESELFLFDVDTMEDYRKINSIKRDELNDL